MKILINGAQPVLKDNFSFEYVAENRLFLGRDGYSLTITFPLKDCPQNVAIFGHISRVDAPHNTLSFDCSIEDKDLKLFGSLIVVKISETEVECQFAEGRCEQTANNSSEFESKYIDALDLGTYPTIAAADCTPEQAWAGCDAGMNAVALPWINEAYPDAPNNWVWHDDSGYLWSSEVTRLSWQPYLLYICEKICDAMGYKDRDFNAWKNSNLRYLICCNTLPASWGKTNFAAALPHWTVSEFFEKLELFLSGEFDFDHRAKTVKFSFSKDVINSTPKVHIESVLDKYTAEITQDADNCDYIGSKRLAYKDCGHEMSKFYSCDWLMPNTGSIPWYLQFVTEYDTLEALIAANKREEKSVEGTAGREIAVLWGHKIPGTYTYYLPNYLYAKDKRTYFTMRSIGKAKVNDDKFPPHSTFIYVLQPLNQFGSGSRAKDDDNTEEIEFCPVCVSDTYIRENDDKGYMMYLSFSSMEDGAEMDAWADAEIDPNNPQPAVVRTLEKGSDDNSQEGYYDVVYIAFWDGAIPVPSAQPFPLVDPVTVTQDWEVVRTQIPSIRLYDSNFGYASQLPKIDPKQKYQFSWLSDTIPNPRSVFYIKGKRFVCEKITATFTKNGMSQLLKGVFYPIVEK